MPIHNPLSEKPFNCPGCVTLDCVHGLKVFAFRPDAEMDWQEFAIRHLRSIDDDLIVCKCPDEERDLYLVTEGAHKHHLRCKTCKKVLPRHIIEFFKGSRLPVTTLLAIAWSMCQGERQRHVLNNFDGQNPGVPISRVSVIQWQVYFSELAFEINAKLFEKVRNFVKFLQIDETAFGKRKYNKGHRVRIGSSIWVWGAVCLGPDGKTIYVHFEYVPCRNTETIVAMLRKVMGPHVTEVASDCWAATVRAMRTEFPTITHKKVNHSREFVAHEGTHTNTIESHNNLLKQTLKDRWAHMPNDAYLLDIKVAFAQMIVNCSPKRLDLDPFTLLLYEILRFGGEAPAHVQDDDDVDGFTTDDEFGMGEEPVPNTPTSKRTWKRSLMPRNQSHDAVNASVAETQTSRAAIEESIHLV